MRGRLPLLLIVMLGLIGLRVWAPPHNPPDASTVEAVVRKPAVSSVNAFDTAAGAAASPITAVKQAEVDVVGNAFMPRTERPPTPTVEPPSPPPVVTAAPPPPVEPPPPPPPPLEIIGTWNDGAAMGVFVSTENGTVIARPGTVLLSQYRVTAVDARQISIINTATQKDWELPVPNAGGTAP